MQCSASALYLFKGENTFGKTEALQARAGGAWKKISQMLFFYFLFEQAFMKIDSDTHIRKGFNQLGLHS